VDIGIGEKGMWVRKAEKVKVGLTLCRFAEQDKELIQYRTLDVFPEAG
jgi:hypothetical protein